MEGGGVTSLCQAWQDGGSRSYSLGRQSVALLAISGTAAPLSSLSLSSLSRCPPRRELARRDLRIVSSSDGTKNQF